MNKLRLKKDMPHEHWLRLRKRGIGGSDAGVIMGVNPYRSILELWEDKTNPLVIDEKESEAAYWGYDHSPRQNEWNYTRSSAGI